MPTDSLLAVSAFILQWIVAPLALLFLLRFGWHFLARARNDEQRLSSSAAFVAGFVIFTITVAFLTPNINFSWWISLLAAIAGFVFLWAVEWMVPAGHVGWLIMILTATSLIGLYCYIQLATLRNAILSGALGLALGILLHIMVRPKAIIKNLVAREGPVDLLSMAFPKDEIETPPSKDA